jgi:hypothetical protein
MCDTVVQIGNSRLIHPIGVRATLLKTSDADGGTPMRRENNRPMWVILRLALLLSTTQLLSSCTDAPLVSTKWHTTSISLSGPAEIKVGSSPDSVNYTVSLTIQHVQPSDALVLVRLYREPQETYAGDALLSWTWVSVPANQNSGTAILPLGCPGNSVVGTAVKEPTGGPNNEGLPPGPDTHVGGTNVFGQPLPAKIHAYAPALGSNTLFVRCIK